MAASPLSVAAVCRDGVALVSLHFGLEELDDDDYAVGDSIAAAAAAADNDDENQSAVVVKDGVDTTIDGTVATKQPSPSHPIARSFRDLPLSSRGPLRIEHVHDQALSSTQSTPSLSIPPPMAILTAGWRTDGMTLADAARELMVEEVMLYCLPSSVMDGGLDCRREMINGVQTEQRKLTGGDAKVSGMINTQSTTLTQPYYGRRIAEGLSYYLSKCEFSDGVRSLSTVGLLACGGTRVPEEDDRSNGQYVNVKGRGGSLYLIDATGAHRVRAHAIGNGSTALHKRLAFVNFDNVSCHEGLRILLRLIAEEGKLLSPSVGDANEQHDDKRSLITSQSDNNRSQENKTTNAVAWNLPQNVAAELAILRSGDWRMKRVRLASLFQSQSSP